MITADEARKLSLEHAGLSDIMDKIREAASEGGRWVMVKRSTVDIFQELLELGFKVKESTYGQWTIEW